MPADPLVASIVVNATPAVVYEHFVRPESLVGWMGDYAILDAQPGGVFHVDINGVPVRGHYLELDPPGRLLISWGHAGSDALPPGTSTVEITITPADDGTLVTVRHTGLPEDQADQHTVGWNHFLQRLGQRAAGQDPGPDPWKTS